MTISNASRTAGPFIGDGVTRIFPFSYKVFGRGDLLVARTVTATSVESILVLDADYTVTLNGNQNTSPGGIITLTTALALGTTLASTSNLPIQQSLDLTNNGGFYPAAINDALDRIVITIQQLASKVGVGALNVGSAAALASLFSTLGNLGSAAGASLVGFLQTGANAILRTAQDIFKERISVMDFMTTAQRADVRAGTTLIDCRAAIQACIDAVNALPAQNRPEVYFPAGRYLVLAPLQMYDNIALVGVRRDIGYLYAFNHSSEIIAGTAMNCVIDITGSNTYIGHLGIYGNNAADYGLYTHIAVGQPRKSSHTIEHVAVTLCKKTGIHLFNLGLSKVRNVQVSSCLECGIDISNSGDSDFTGLYINSNNADSTSTVNAPSSATVYGVGVRVRDNSGNINFRGGKVEFNRIGFLLNNVDGVNITGVNFDTNRKASVYIDADSITAYPNVAVENANAVTSVQVSGCRFLGGTAGATQTPSTHIFAANCRYVTVSGNGFKRAGDAARDFATDTAQGPNYGVHLYNAEICTVVGNNLYGAATTNCLRIEHATPANGQHTVQGNSLDDTESVAIGTVRSQPNFGNLTFASGANPIAQSTAKAWVKFNGITGAIYASYNVASISGASGTYKVNFVTAMPNGLYSAQVSVRNWYGFTDNGMPGLCEVDGVTVYSLTGASLSANGEISVAVFG